MSHYPAFATYMGNFLRKFPMTQAGLIRTSPDIMSGLCSLKKQKPENILWFYSLVALTELAVGLGSRNPNPATAGYSPQGFS